MKTTIGAIVALLVLVDVALASHKGRSIAYVPRVSTQAGTGITPVMQAVITPWWWAHSKTQCDPKKQRDCRR